MERTLCILACPVKAKDPSISLRTMAMKAELSMWIRYQAAQGQELCTFRVAFPPMTHGDQCLCQLNFDVDEGPRRPRTTTVLERFATPGPQGLYLYQLTSVSL